MLELSVYLLLTNLFPSYMQSQKSKFPEIDKILISEIKQNRTPSVSYEIFSGDSIIHSFSDGYVDILAKRKADSSTTYNILSVTKTFTALAVLQLAEQRLIDLNYPVKTYLPVFAYNPQITIKQILSHTSGIPNPVPLKWIHLASEHSNFDRNKFFNEIIKRHNKTAFNPGEKYKYSNIGYFILGQLIEKVTGLTYEEYISKNIIDKLKIGSSELSFTLSNPAAHAKGYIKKWSFLNLILGVLLDKSKYINSSEGKWNSFNDFYVNGPSYGGLISTRYALIKYLQALLKHDCSLLTDEYKKLLFTKSITSAGKLTKMCLAWFTGDLNENKYYYHAGGGGGYYCEIRLYPDLNIGSIILFNRTGISDEKFLDKLDKYIIPRKKN